MLCTLTELNWLICVKCSQPASQAVQKDDQYPPMLGVEDSLKNSNSNHSSLCRWMFIYRPPLSPVELQNLHKAESGPILPSAGQLTFSWKCTRVEMLAGVLIFWLFNWVSARLLHSCVLLILLSVDALIC